MKLSKGKLVKLLLGTLIVALLFTYVWPWAATHQIGSAYTSMTIAFKGAGKGLDPQGNRFDINELKNKDILQKAIDETGMADSLTVDELKRRLYILPQAKADTLKELLTLTTITGKTQDTKERIVYPTSFTVGLKDMGIPSPFESRKLLDNIMKAYQVHLKVKYLSDTLSEPAYTLEELLKLDYPEMMMVLNQEAESMLLYIGFYANNEPLFTSKTTGLSFPDLYQQAVLLKDTDIGNMRSLVDYFELTEDAERRMLYADTMLKRAGVIANKLYGEQLTAEEIIQIYDNSSNYIFASGESVPVNLEPVENQFYGDLIKALVDKQNSFINAKYDQQDIQRAIAKLQAVSLTGDSYIQMTKEIKAGTSEAMERIEALSQMTRKMAEELYDSNVGNKIYVGGISYDVRSNGNFLINFVFLAALCLLAVIACREIKKSRYNKYFEMICKMIVQLFRRKRQEKET
ncbi:MAG: hypothetical protein PHE79_01620 [Eubacteriales bacterium]|nr:hypothetical protein [Eubacteriales bacterium]